MIPFGIVGTNWITHSYVAAAHATGNWTLAAVYSRTADTAQAFAAKYEGKQVAIYTSLNDLARDPGLSTVYIASPNILHYEQAKLLLTAGKNVVVEKPSCSTVAELDDLLATAREKGVFLIEAFRHVQEANFKVLKGQIPRLGSIYGASFTYANYSSRYNNVLAGEVPNIFNLAMGGGALVDLGVYCISAAIDLFGAPDDAKYWPVKIRTGADGAGRMLLTYPNFSVALCHSKIYNSETPSEIYGEKGTLVLSSVTDIEKVTFWDALTKEKRDVEGLSKLQELNMQAEAEEFARVIKGKDMEAAARYEALSREVLKVMEKVRRENGLLFPGET